MRSDGTLDGWRSQLGRRRVVGGLVRVGDVLFVHDGYRAFAVSATSGAALWASQRAHQGPRIGVLAMAATSAAVFVGGYLTRVGDAPRHQLAALDSRSGRLLAWQAPPLGYYRGSTPTVTALAVSARRLYLAGGFLRIGRTKRVSGAAGVRLRDGAVMRFAPRSALRDPTAIVVVGRTVLIAASEGGGRFDGETGARRPAKQPLPLASVISVRRGVAYVGGNLRDSVGGHNLLAIDLRTG